MNPAGRYMSNGNLLAMNTVHTTVGKISSDTDPCDVPNPPEWCYPTEPAVDPPEKDCSIPGNCPTAKYKTYIDVRHPKTIKIIDRNKGTVS
jgi:hypothetical protein